MKTLDLLAAIGMMTVGYLVAKTVLAVNEVVNGPTKINSTIGFKKKEKNKEKA